MRQPYEKLPAWRANMVLVRAVYKLAAVYPADEKSGLSATLRRTATNVPMKIATAWAMDDQHKPGAADELRQARRTIAELETLGVVSFELGLISSRHLATLRKRCRKADAALDKLAALYEVRAPVVEPTEPLKLAA